MVASLLLEGPDLRALLEQAHKQGGPKARIVRAEKVRHGGVLGFFAREVFEVAVEIPDPDEGQEQQPDVVAPASAAPAPGRGETSATPAVPPVKAEVTPIPTGLMDLAERVDAQELAEARETVAHAADAAAQLAEVPALELPALDVPAFPAHGTWPTGIETRRVEEPVVEPLVDPAPVAVVPVDDEPMDDEPEAQPRPQFTALIDQLRDGVRDGRHREDGYRHTTDHPVVAALHAGLTEDPTHPEAVEHGLGTQHVVSALEAEAWAHVMTGNDPASETDGSTMSESTANEDIEALYADLDPHPFAASDHGSGSDHEPVAHTLTPVPDAEHDDADEPVDAAPAAPTNRAASILPKAAKPAKPAKPSRRRGFTPLRSQVDDLGEFHDEDDERGSRAETSEATRAMVEEAVAGRAAERNAKRASERASEVAGSHRAPQGSRRSDAPLKRNPEPAAEQAAPPAAEVPATVETAEKKEPETRGEVLPSTPPSAADRRASWWRLGRKRREPVEPTHWIQPDTDAPAAEAPTEAPTVGVETPAPAGQHRAPATPAAQPADAPEPAPAVPAAPRSAFDSAPAFESPVASKSAFATGSALPTPMPRPSFPTPMPTASVPVPSAPPAPVAPVPTASGPVPSAAPAPVATPAPVPTPMPAPIPMPVPLDEPTPQPVAVAEAEAPVETPEAESDFEASWISYEPAAGDYLEPGEPPTYEPVDEPAYEPAFEPAAYETAAPAVQSAMPEQRTGGFTAAVTGGPVGAATAGVIGDVDELADDRQALRDLGLPAAWTRRLVAGDRFTSVLGILDRLPELEIDGDDPVIVVVGPADVVELEAHRTALDLPVDGRPRAVVALPGTSGEDVRTAVAAANGTRPVVVAVPLDFGQDATEVRALIHDLHTHSVIAVVDATQSLEAMTTWFDSLERVDAIALDRALESSRPAAVLGLDVPVVRLDGIAMDRIGWAALLCAQLAARDLEQLADAR